MGTSEANESRPGPIPVEVLDVNFQPLDELRPSPPRRPFPWLPIVLFLLTLLSTLAVGSEFASSYSQNAEPFSGDDNPFSMMLHPVAHPALLLLGVPFSFTLLTILMAHEMGHFFACKFTALTSATRISCQRPRSSELSVPSFESDRRLRPGARYSTLESPARSLDSFLRCLLSHTPSQFRKSFRMRRPMHP